MHLTDLIVRDNQQARCYEAVLDGTVAGMVIYERRGQRLVIRSTIVEPGLRGRGIGSRLVQDVLDRAAEQGDTITNYCGFVSDFIAGHPGYARLLDPEHPGRTSTGAGQ